MEKTAANDVQMVEKQTNVPRWEYAGITVRAFTKSEARAQLQLRIGKLPPHSGKLIKRLP